nr:HAD-IC family P-type ATPase [uncultured Anaeromusa sp.]
MKHSNLSSAPLWHHLSTKDALDGASASIDGLSTAEASLRLSCCGENVLPTKPAASLGMLFLHQFYNPLIYVLCAAAAVSLWLGESGDAIFISGVLVINSLLGSFQEWRAEKSAVALQALIRHQIRVRRNSQEAMLNAKELVPGDIVLLESGSRIPADLRLLETEELLVDESLLTGESQPLNKKTVSLPPDTPFGDRNNMAYGGSSVISGRGIGLVIATGIQTEVGRIAVAVTDTQSSQPPLVGRMEKFSKDLSIIIVAACLLMALAGVWKGLPHQEVFYLAVALMVSVIPEGLPIAVTVALSVATTRMAKRHVIVRRLAAVETLGSCTYIASDKTGTLTKNEQTVRLLWLPQNLDIPVSGEGYTPHGSILSPSETLAFQLHKLAQAAVLCNEADLRQEGTHWNHHGDAVDIALLTLGYKAGLDVSALKRQNPPLAYIPFESERRFTAHLFPTNASLLTSAYDPNRSSGEIIASPEGYTVYLKGAVETILEKCLHMQNEQGCVPLQASLVLETAERLAAAGYRVLAIASGIIADLGENEHFDEPDLQGLTFLGLAGLQDPLRPEAREAILACRHAGIEVAMVTGDHPQTALAIAKELGLASSSQDVVTGLELESCGAPATEKFKDAVKKARVFARVSPLQKLQIITVLTQLGHYIAVTGDGVNDAPALKKAHLGIAMGSGTDVAKDTASLIITDDNFASIVAGVEEGRYVYDNIRKVIFLLTATGAAEITLFFFSVLTGAPLPLTAAQILWLNLIATGVQYIGLLLEPGDPASMNRPPRRPGESLFNASMVQQVALAGITMGSTAFLFWWWYLSTGRSLTEGRSLVLLVLVLLENIHLFNCRSETRSVWQLSVLANPAPFCGVLIAQSLQLLAMNTHPLQTLLRLLPPSPQEWLTGLCLASTVHIAIELLKWRRRRNT